MKSMRWTNGFEYYVNQTHEMDAFVAELIDALSKRDEKTILVIYGDHLPTFDITDDDLKNGDIYQTQYVIWNNYNLQIENKDVQEKSWYEGRSYFQTPYVTF